LRKALFANCGAISYNLEAAWTPSSCKEQTVSNELHLDEQTYARAKRLADERNVTVEEVVSTAIERLAATPGKPETLTDVLGAFADCADLLDEIVNEAYQNRERYPLRLER
jgi:hypothetical protein